MWSESTRQHSSPADPLGKVVLIFLSWRITGYSDVSIFCGWKAREQQPQMFRLRFPPQRRKHVAGDPGLAALNMTIS
jgi:hypothetical protein